MGSALIERLRMDVRNYFHEAANNQAADDLDMMRKNAETAVAHFEWMVKEGYKPSSHEFDETRRTLLSFGYSESECDGFLVTKGKKKKDFGKAGGSEHTSEKSPSKRNKHEEGKARLKRDRGNEKGDIDRPPPRRRPKHFKGPWPMPRSLPIEPLNEPESDLDNEEYIDEGASMDGREQYEKALNQSRKAENNGGEWPVDLLIEAAETGVPEAVYALSTWYANGRGVKRDLKKALSLLKKAADQRYALAEFDLAVSYEEGIGVKKNAKKAFLYYLMSAEDGDLDGQTEVARCYFYGIGTAKNVTKAVEWYKIAANRGDAESQVTLGRAYELGDGVGKNSHTALSWYRKAANTGNELAKKILADIEKANTKIALNIDKPDLVESVKSAATK